MARKPIHRSQQAGEQSPLCPESEAPGSHDKRTCRQEQEQRPVCGEEEWEGRALPEESGSLVIPGCTRELPGSRGLPLAG